jgi:IclR family transcriptional regulator, KDG regulon repressor
MAPVLELADRTIRILETFGVQDGALTLTDIAERMALPKSSVHRLLATLIQHQFVERDASTRRYRLGIRLFEIGSRALYQRGVRGAVYPLLEELAGNTGETCHLAVLSGTEVVYVQKIDGQSNFSMSSRVGGRAPCHCTSIGKVLIAWGRPEVCDTVIEAGLRQFTQNTITTAEQLRGELELVHRQGYAYDLEEYEDGLRCIAAPVWDHSQRVIAAIGIAGPTRHLSNDRLPSLVESVLRAAAELSRNLGHIPETALATANAV